MSKGVELTEKELKEVSGGAYVKDGYVYYQYNGKNKKQKILYGEEAVKGFIETLTNQGYSDEKICESFVAISNHLGKVEDC